MIRNSTTEDEYSKQDKRGRHIKTGLAKWLVTAPAEASFAEVIEAYQSHDSPSDVWGESDV